MMALLSPADAESAKLSLATLSEDGITNEIALKAEKTR